MKFFNNLPKTNFESTIGSFRISNFFTYLDVQAVKVQEATITIDNKTTLVEAAHNVYNDQDSIWAFVAASDTINPFKLAAINPIIFQKNNEDKINLALFGSSGATSGGYVFPAGSIVVPKTGNTGSTSSYGFTGNYDLNGPFTVIQETYYYDGNMTIGSQAGGTGPFISLGTAYDNVVVLKLTSGGTYEWAGDFYAGNKKQATSKVVYLSQNNNGKAIYSDTSTSNITIADELPESPPVQGTTSYVPYTLQQLVELKSKNIQIYTPSEIGLLQASFVTPDYA